MKKIYLSLIVAILSGVVLLSCDNAKYKEIGNSIYLADADGKNKSKTLSVDGEIDLDLVVRLAQRTTEDTRVKVLFDETNLQAYNEMNGTDYQPVPKDKLPENPEVLIPAGELSGKLSLHIDQLESTGVIYAIPVEIGEVLQGGVEKSESRSEFIYVLTQPLIVSVPVMTGESGMVEALPESDWGIVTKQWTLEAWVRMDGYSINNQAIFNTGSKGTDNANEIYIRFGDANGPFNYLQAKIFGGQVETARDLEPGKWYHWAFVYDGTNFTIYRNGKKDVSFMPPAVPEVHFNYMQMIASGSYFKDRCAMSQVRLWNVARSELEISNNMYYAVNPNTDLLIASWPMDEGEGNTFKDVTENGHDATAASGVIKEWEPDVRFDK